MTPTVTVQEAGGDGADDGVGRLGDHRIWTLLTAHIARGMKYGSSHAVLPCCRVDVGFMPSFVVDAIEYLTDKLQPREARR